MARAAKSTKKFAASGKLKKTIHSRRKHQQVRRVQSKKVGKDIKIKRKRKGTSDGYQSEHVPDSSRRSNDSALNEPDFDGETYKEDDESESDEDDLDAFLGSSRGSESDEDDLDAPLGSSGGSEHDSADSKLPVLTLDILRKWQKTLLEHRSLHALRKLLIAFRSAAHVNEDGQVLAWSIDQSSVYNELVQTALRCTPVVLQHHIPYKTPSDGKIKPPPQTEKLKALQKLILSYFHNIIHIVPQLTDTAMVQLCITESAKLIPYIIASRKAVKQYLKICLQLWSSADDSTRVTAFMAVRKLMSSTDRSIIDIVLKATYLTLVRSSKTTSAYSLPSINLMKNSASEIYCIDQATSYQHAFGYIRQLAIHLRNSIKLRTKEAYKHVYNWRYVHCVDFWTIVIARACNTKAENPNQESELQPLIYPLVQVSLGAVRLSSNSCSFPFHLQIIRSLLHLANHTHTYIPIAPYLLPILTSNLSFRPKPSTVRPIDLEVRIRAPLQYLKTRVYAESLVEETTFLLAEWLASTTVQGSIAFPEVIIPVVVGLRKALRTAKSLLFSKGNPGANKEVGNIKGLLERIEESARLVELKRKAVTFSPGKVTQVHEWESEMKVQVEALPLSKHVRLLRKMRAKRRKLAEQRDVEEDGN